MDDTSRLYLCAPVNAIVEGIYEEKIPFSEIKLHGDFGLGTFDQLDGEMVMVDGRIFQIPADGRVQEVGEEAHTPFSCVTFFRPSLHATIDSSTSYEEFLVTLERLLPSPNIFYAIRVEGLFDYVKTRSVPKTECYIPLVEVAAHQPVFEFEDITGTLVGFYTPDFMAAVSVPGMHLHFLSDDLSHGGHLLNCRPRRVSIALQPLLTLELALPATEQYLQTDLQRDVRDDLERAEN